MVLRLWDYAQTIFRSEKLHISYAIPEIGSKKPEIGAKSADNYSNRYQKVEKTTQNKYALIRFSSFLLFFNPCMGFISKPY